MTLGEKLKMLRKKKNKTTQEVSKEINIGRSSLANYENDLRNPDYDTLKLLSNFYNASIAELLDEEPKDTFTSEELKDKIPQEFKELFGEEGLKYIKFAKKMKEEDITPEMLEDLLETLKKYKDQIK